MGGFILKKTAFVLAILMILSVTCLSSCQKETAYETYVNAYNKTAELTANYYDATMSGEIEVILDGETYTAPIDGSIKRTKDSNGIPIIDEELTSSYMGKEISLDFVYANGWAYINYLGIKTKK